MVVIVKYRCKMIMSRFLQSRRAAQGLTEYFHSSDWSNKKGLSIYSTEEGIIVELVSHRFMHGPWITDVGYCNGHGRSTAIRTWA